MTYRGRIENGKVVIDEPVDLPEGLAVSVRLLKGRPVRQKEPQPIPSLYERLKNVIGKAEGLPEDAARNIDHYLYGLPKK